MTNQAQNPVFPLMHYIRPKISNLKIAITQKVNKKLTQSFCMGYLFPSAPTIFQVRLTNYLWLVKFQDKSLTNNWKYIVQWEEVNTHRLWYWWFAFLEIKVWSNLFFVDHMALA